MLCLPYDLSKSGWEVEIWYAHLLEGLDVLFESSEFSAQSHTLTAPKSGILVGFPCVFFYFLFFELTLPIIRHQLSYELEIRYVHLVRYSTQVSWWSCLFNLVSPLQNPWKEFSKSKPVKNSTFYLFTFFSFAVDCSFVPSVDFESIFRKFSTSLPTPFSL